MTRCRRVRVMATIVAMDGKVVGAAEADMVAAEEGIEAAAEEEGEADGEQYEDERHHRDI